MRIDTATPEAIQAFADEIIREFIQKCEENDWEDGGVERDVHIYRKDFAPIKAVKGVGIVRGDIERMFELTKQVEYIGKWDHLFIGGKIIHSYDEHTDVITVRYNSGVPLVSGRDFVYLESRRKLADGTYIIAATSVEHPAVPESRQFVRAEVRSSGWMLKPNGEGAVLTTYIAQVDPKGMIPKSLVKAASGTEALNVDNLRKCLAAHS